MALAKWRRDHQSRALDAWNPISRGADGPATKQAAFTLIEVLLALALLAALLTAINQFVFSITEAWTKNHDQFVFVQHSRAVTRHIDELLQTAANSARASNVTTGAPAVAEVNLPDGAGNTELLSFDLPMGDRLFVWPGQPLPEVRCSLGWRQDEGLVLYWKSRLETDFATADPRMVVVSSFVTGLAYDYYDEAGDKWTTEDELQQDAAGAYLAPRRLRLSFERNGQKVEEIIPLPATKQEGLPVY